MQILNNVIAATKGQLEDGGTIALDFDGVLHAYTKGWADGSIYDKPIDGTEEALVSLLDGGYKLFIFTARPNKNEIPKWLATNFTDKRIHKIRVTNKKEPAQIYLDDRGVRFDSWEQSLSFIKKMSQGK